MKIRRKLLITTSLIALLSVNMSTYAVTSKVVENNVTYETLFKEYEEIDFENQLDINNLLTKDLSIKKNITKPQILIVNSHPQETYRDNQGSVIDVATELERVLEENYQVSVLHYKAPSNDKVTTVGAYEKIESVIASILKEHPSIEVILDIHRDGGMEPSAREINHRSTAKINIVNGLSLDVKTGKIGSSKEYPNEYIEDNLSFSAQLKYASQEVMDELISPIALAPFRYSLHMAPKSLLVDIGNNNDTLEEATNAVYPFTKVLAEVLNLEKITK